MMNENCYIDKVSTEYSRNELYMSVLLVVVIYQEYQIRYSFHYYY